MSESTYQKGRYPSPEAVATLAGVAAETRFLMVTKAAQPAEEDEPAAPAPLRGEQAARLLPNLGKREIATLGAMAASGKIGSAELIAANRWYCVYAMAFDGVMETDSAGATGKPLKLFEQERKTAAMAQYRQAKASIGERADGRLRMVLSDGMTMVDVAKATGQDRKVASGMVIADLQRLAEHYTKT